MTAPGAAGIYYYGACVDAVGNDPRSDNNCSTAAVLRVSTTDRTRMYWVDPTFSNSKIQRADINGSNIETLVTQFHGLIFPADIDLDMVNRKMYWVDNRRNVIQRANLDGSNIEDLLTMLPRLSVDSIALDVAGGMMYWVQYGDGLWRAHLDGSNIESLPLGCNDIALDMAAGKIYCTGENIIYRANINGSNREDLVTIGLGRPTAITLDVAAGKMYWTDYGTDKIQRANLDGSNVEDLVKGDAGLVGPAGIALDVAAGKMYWTDFETDKIQRANLDGSHIENLITRGLEHVISIALDTPHPHNYRPIQLSPSEIADQSFTVDTEVSLTLPIAHGGTPSYTYTLSPILPSGLTFDPVARSITGTPTAALPLTTFTYTATDAVNAAVTTIFTIEIVGEQPPPGPTPGALDANGDGRVDVLDLVWVAMFYGRRGADLTADVNADEVVNVQDFILVAAAVDATETLPEAVEAALQAAMEAEGIAEAPSSVYSNVATAFADTNSDVLYQVLRLLAELRAIPETTALLPNYPNPFNPETWIPYHLATDAEVMLMIYDVRGAVVRTLTLGHQPAGVYESRGRAAYWDGKNQLGEHVASGVYFYTLSTESTRDSVTAGDFTATRKLLMAK